MGKSYYKELIIWQESIGLIKDIYKLAELLPSSEEYNLKQQLKRSAISVSLNIAEGKTRKTKKDFANFLNMSASSLAEVEAILVICEELNYLENVNGIYSKIEILGKKINALKSKLNVKENK